MDAEAKQSSLIIESVSKAVANWSVDWHAEQNPHLKDRYGPGWRDDWIGHTQSQIALLAQAIAIESQEVFSCAVRWSYESFRAREVCEAELIENTRCLGEVLRKELPPAIGTLAKSYVDTALEGLQSSESTIDADGQNADSKSALVLEYLEYILKGDRRAAEEFLLAVSSQGMPISQIYEDILAPAQDRLGRMWHRGEVSVADEHVGSATTKAVMSQLRLHFDRAASNGRTLVAAATSGDLHEIGLQMVTDLFELNGWNVVYLGANTPTVDIIEVLDRHHPELFALSVSSCLTLRVAADLIDEIRSRKSLAHVKIIVGGGPFMAIDDLWHKLGADGCGGSASQAVEFGNRLVAG